MLKSSIQKLTRVLKQRELSKKKIMIQNLHYLKKKVLLNLLLCAIILLSNLSLIAQTNPEENGFLSLNNTSVGINPITLTGDFTVESWVYFTEGQAIDNKDGLVAAAGQPSFTYVRRRQ